MGRGFASAGAAYRFFGSALNQIEAVNAGLALAALDEIAQGLVLFCKAFVQATVQVASPLDEFDGPVRGRRRPMNSHVQEGFGSVNKVLEF